MPSTHIEGTSLGSSSSSLREEGEMNEMIIRNKETNQSISLDGTMIISSNEEKYILTGDTLFRIVSEYTSKLKGETVNI